MAKIIYLLGAGASFGKRGNEAKGFPIDIKKLNSTHHSFDTCANIIEGLPVVCEIPNRIKYIISEIYKEINKSYSTKPQQDSLQRLINDLEWMYTESRRHNTIDTFAKKLYLTKQWAAYERLKRIVSAYFMLEQLLGQTDKRYDTFYASILGNHIGDFPKNLCVVSWNYDCQFELAFKEYFDTPNLDKIQTHLNISHKIGVKNRTDNFSIIKLNGTALMYNESRNEFIDAFDNNHNMNPILQIVSVFYDKNHKCALSFAWENMMNDFEERIIKCVEEAEILVVIGYSFPFFNRSVDKLLFDNMPKLKKIYLQDKDPNKIEESVNNLLTASHRANKTIIEKKYQTEQFYLPPEL